MSCFWGGKLVKDILIHSTDKNLVCAKHCSATENHSPECKVCGMLDIKQEIKNEEQCYLIIEEPIISFLGPQPTSLRPSAHRFWSKTFSETIFFFFLQREGKKEYKMLNLVAIKCQKYGYSSTNFLYFQILFYKYYFCNGKK